MKHIKLYEDFKTNNQEGSLITIFYKDSHFI